MKFIRLLFLLLLPFWAFTADDKTITPISHLDKLNEIKIGVYILGIDDFELKDGEADIDFYLSMQCSNGCDQQDFEIMNGKILAIDKITDTKNEQFYRIYARMRVFANIKMFPLDSQVLKIVIEDKRNNNKQVQYVENKRASGLDNTVHLPGWKINGNNVRIINHYYPAYNETYSQYTFSIPMDRVILSSIMKFFLPVTFIVILLLTSIFINIENILIRLMIVGSALLASLLFNLNFEFGIPSVNYLTFADYLMLMTCVFVVTCLVCNLILFDLMRRNKKTAATIADKCFKIFVAIIPVVYVIFMIFVRF